MQSVEYTFVTCQGELIDVEAAAAAITFNDQPASQVSIHDITERKATERKLRQLSRITEQAPIAIVITNLVGVIEYVNPWFSAITGYSAEEAIGRNPRLLQSGQTPPAVYADLWNTLHAGGVWHGEFHNKKRNGEVFIESAVIAPVLDASGVVSHYVAIKEDVTDQRRHEDALTASLQEKTALLNEVHHRVKNNLQVVTSLLRLEAGRAGDATTRAVLHEMQGRIRSMALVHETLYRSGTFASVDLQSYVRQVASAAFRAQAHTSGAVRLVLDLAPVQVSLDQATPCGLLVNELISNCIKHGFAHGEQGEVRVELQPVAGNDGGPALWCLRVSDTGADLPVDFEERRSHSLGLQLVGDLAGQLGGTLTVEAGPGASFAVTFPVTSS
jgi:PAS domain S-box-containing protein